MADKPEEPIKKENLIIKANNQLNHNQLNQLNLNNKYSCSFKQNTCVTNRRAITLNNLG